MSDPAFLTIGTPGGQWPAWLSSLLGAHAGAAGGPTADPAALPPASPAELDWGADGGDADAPGDTLAQRLPDAQVLVLVERPALGLAAALAAGEVDDPTQWLQDWCEGARRLLWRVQSDPHRCLLVDAEEAWQHPEALAANVNQRFGLEVAAAQAAADLSSVDPLSRALAEAIAGVDRDAQALFDELQASCVLLAAEPPVSASLLTGPQIDGRSAARHLRHLRTRLRAAEDEAMRGADAMAALQAQLQEQQALLRDMTEQLARQRQLQQQSAGDLASSLNENQSLRQQLAERESGLAQLHRAHQQQTQVLQDTQQGLADTQRDLAAVRQENELMLLQLHQVQEELESMLLARRDAEAQRAAATAERDQALQQHGKQLQDAQARLGAMEIELKRARQQHEQALAAAQRDAEQAAQATAAELATAQRDLASTRQESELLLQQLHQVQEELESIFLARREAEARLADVTASHDTERQAQAQRLAEHQQQIAQRDQAVQQLTRQLQEAQARLNTLQAEIQRHAQQREQAQRAAQQAEVAQQADKAAAAEQAAALDTAQRELAARQRELADTRQENELMLQQLHQVQEELEHYYLECRRLHEEAASTVPGSAAVKLAVAEVLPSAERNSPPHRELTFQLRQVVVDDRMIPEATVRLVEHHGHPGLVVFGNPQGPQLLSSWRETGREDGRPYMLLVPADDPARPLLEAMGYADWQLLQTLPGWLEHALQAPELRLGRHWQQLARRLHGQLQAQGRRLRYRQVQLSPAADGPPGALALRFGDVHWGAQQLPSLTVRWQPEGPQAGIVLMNDAVLGPPLTCWPDDEQGQPLERLTLPLGRDVPQHDQRQAWARLSALDRDFMLALLTVWPQALSQAGEGAAPAAPAVAEAAEALLPDALRAVRRAGRWLRPRRQHADLRRQA